VLEDALAGAMAQIGHAGPQADPIARHAPAGVALCNAVDLAVNTAAGGAEGQKSRAMQQVIKIQVGALADQLQRKRSINSIFKRAGSRPILRS